MSMLLRASAAPSQEASLSAATPAPATSGPATPAGIEFRDVTVRGHEDFVMLDSLNLRVERGEVVALLGPSGAGKTTALRAVAGFAQPAHGRILVGGVDVTDSPTRDRGLGMVVQNYALFPHMTVAQNVEFGLRSRKTPKDERAGRVAEVLAMVGMESFARRHPRQLSGGQQQRVAIARALAANPDVLLLDEPLSALDAQLRQDMLTELARLHRELPDLTMLYVTHGQNEALTLADRIAVMAKSRLVEMGTTADLFTRPRHEFTARFLGGCNVLPVISTGPRSAVLAADPEVGFTVSLGDARAGEETGLCVRPHHLRLLAAGETAENELELVVEDVQWRGSTHLVHGSALGTTLALESLQLTAVPHVGERLRVGFSAEHAAVLREDRS